MEGHSLSGCTAQKQSQTQEHGGTPGQSDSTDWGPKHSQEAGETNHQCMEGQGGGGVAGEGKNRGIKADEEPGQWGNKAEANCRYTCLQDMTKPEVRLNEIYSLARWMNVYYTMLLFSLFECLHSTYSYNLKFKVTIQLRHKKKRLTHKA